PDESDTRREIRVMPIPVRSGDARIARKEKPWRRGRMERAQLIREKSWQAEGIAATVFIGIGECRFPPQAEIQAQFFRNPVAVLSINAHDPLAKIVRRGVGLNETAHVTRQKIGHSQAARLVVSGELTIEAGSAVLVESGDGVVLDADQVDSEGHLMVAPDDVHVVRDLV